MSGPSDALEAARAEGLWIPPGWTFKGRGASAPIYGTRDVARTPAGRVVGVRPDGLVDVAVGGMVPIGEVIPPRETEQVRRIYEAKIAGVVPPTFAQAFGAPAARPDAKGQTSPLAPPPFHLREPTPAPAPPVTVRALVKELYDNPPRWALDGQARRRGERWEAFKVALAGIGEPLATLHVNDQGRERVVAEAPITREAIRTIAKFRVDLVCGPAPAYGE